MNSYGGNNEKIRQRYAAQALTDLIIRIILLILDKLLSKRERGEGSFLKISIT